MDLVGLAKQNKLNSLEKPGQVYLTFEPFSEENGLLTPTSKMKRNDAKKFFATQIDALYKLPQMREPKKWYGI